MTPPSTKPKSKSKESSVTDRLKDFYRKELDLNGNPKDKNAFDDLRKKSWTDENVKLNENSRSMTKRILGNILKEKGFTAPEGIGEKVSSSAESGGVIAEFAKDIKKSIIGESPTQPNTETKSYGIFSKNPQSTTAPAPGAPGNAIPQNTETTEKKQISLADQQKMMRAIFNFPKQMYYKFDLVEGEKEKPKEIPKNFSEEVDEFADNLANYCFENNIHLPTWIEGFGLVLVGLMLFGAPLGMKIMSARKEKKKENSNKLEGHSLAEEIAKQERQKVTES